MNEFVYTLDTIVDCMLSDTPYNGHHIVGLRIFPDRLIIYEGQDKFLLTNPIEITEIINPKELPLNIMALKSYIANKTRVCLIDLDSANDYSSCVGIRVVYSTENFIAYNNTPMQVLDTVNIIELRAINLYPNNSLEADQVKAAYPIQPETVGDVYDARYSIIEYLVACNELDTNITKMLLNNSCTAYQNVNGDLTYQHMDGQSVQERTLTSVSKLPVIENYLVYKKLGLSSQSISTQAFTLISNNKLIQIPNFHKVIDNITLSKIKDVKTGIFICNDTLIDTVLHQLYSAETCLTEAKETPLKCLALSMTPTVQKDISYRVDTLSTPTEDEKLTRAESLKASLHTLQAIYDVVVVPTQYNYLSMQDIIKLSQSCIVILIEDFNSIQDLAEILSYEPKYTNILLERLHLIIDASSAQAIYVTSALKRLLQEKNPVLQHVDFNLVAAKYLFQNEVTQVYFTQFLSIILKNFDSFFITETDLFIETSQGLKRYKSDKLVLAINKNLLNNFILSLNDDLYLQTISEDTSGIGSCLITIDDYTVKCSLYNTDSHIKIRFEKLSQPLKGNHDVVTKYFFGSSTYGLPTGIWYINTPPEGGKKTLLKSLLPDITAHINDDRILLLNYELDITEQDFYRESNSNLISSHDITITRDEKQLVPLIDSLKPGVIIISRLRNPKVFEDVLNLISSRQLVILLTPCKNLYEALHYTIQERNLKLILNQYFGGSISQQLVPLANGELYPLIDYCSARQLNDLVKDNLTYTTLYDQLFLNNDSLEIEQLYQSGEITDEVYNQYRRN